MRKIKNGKSYYFCDCCGARGEAQKIRYSKTSFIAPPLGWLTLPGEKETHLKPKHVCRDCVIIYKMFETGCLKGEGND